MCVPKMKYSVNCHPDYTEYPYDVQICTIELASWAHSTDEIDLMMAPKRVLSFTSRSLERDVLYYDHFIDTSKFKINENLETRIYGLILIIARRAENMHIVFVVPGFVLMALALCALWLDCHSNERIIVSSISFICHLICIQRVYWSIPHNGNIAPSLLRYYESSFLIMAFVMVLTVLLRELHALKSPAPEWLSATTSSILRSKVGQLLLLSILDPKASAFLEISADDNNELVDGDGEDRSKSESNTSTWSYVALIIGWVAFVLIFFAYIVMLSMYLPYKPNYDADYYRKLNSEK
ncbi:proton-gated ion channel subunit pbo-6 [Nasonia vitripennis]|uniref:Neurotransmitter-gated ion-channel ligand-binding domain-containing protein n=2 Tax=Nasonia vitripennis TaxID=7425 RepID=A0A7M7PX37_NASVI|nr:proton-gated ion channel subunit pbo-6 [Nasonia vitripennis]